MNAIKLSFTLL